MNSSSISSYLPIVSLAVTTGFSLYFLFRTRSLRISLDSEIAALRSEAIRREEEIRIYEDLYFRSSTRLYEDLHDFAKRESKALEDLDEHYLWCQNTIQERLDIFQEANLRIEDLSTRLEAKHDRIEALIDKHYRRNPSPNLPGWT